MESFIRKLNRYLFVIALISLTITFFMKNNYRAVEDIDPKVLKNPIQNEVRNRSKIKFTKDDYAYELRPLYDYEINGLIVNRMDYRWFSIYKRDSVFPVDLCLMWGDNMERKIYQNKTLSFKQDFRFCLWSYAGQITVNNNEVANVHLLLNDNKFEKELKFLATGDQVSIKGKLVNVTAKNIGEAGKYDPPEFSMNSSTTRDDSGGGACEVLYVEDIEIIKKGNPLANQIFYISYYTFLALIAINIILFIFGVMFSYIKYSK